MNRLRNGSKLAAVILGLFIWLPSGVLADEISLSMYANVLKTANGEAMPTSGLVLLVASTNDAVFGGPTASAFTTGDDVVVYRWDLALNGSPGFLYDAAYGLTFFGGWSASDPLAVYWFPTLTTNSVTPTNGAPYGIYHDPVGADGSDPWLTPPGGTTFVDLKFKTAEAGSSVNSSSAGQALWVVGNPFSQVTAVVTTTGTNSTVTFNGIPNHQYATERSTNLVSGLGWVSISTNIVPTTGVFQVTDSFSDLGLTPPPIPSPAFYRLRYDGP